MTKVVFGEIDENEQARTKPPNVLERRVRGADGRLTIMRTIDARSDSFERDLLYVFKKSVARARRENKRLLGVYDVVPNAEIKPAGE